MAARVPLRTPDETRGVAENRRPPCFGKEEPRGPGARVIAKIDGKKLPGHARWKCNLSKSDRWQLWPSWRTVLEIGYAIERRYRALRAAADCWPLGYSNDSLLISVLRNNTRRRVRTNAYLYDDEPATYAGEARSILDTAVRLLAKIDEQLLKLVRRLQIGHRSWVNSTSAKTEDSRVARLRDSRRRARSTRSRDRGSTRPGVNGIESVRRFCLSIDPRKLRGTVFAIPA